MRNHLGILFVALIFECISQNGEAATTNNLAFVRTNFVSDATLTAADLDTVVKLAKSCGIEQIAEVRTFHYLPTSVRGIIVTSSEMVNGRKVTYRTLEVFREGWAMKPKPTGPLQASSIGQFWVEGIGMAVHHELTIFNTPKGTLRVKVETEIPIDIADKIIKAFTAKKIQFTGSFVKQDFESENNSQPEWLGVGGHDGKYWISFSGGLNRYQFVLIGNEVKILSVLYINI